MEIERYIRFLEEAENLKNVTRTAWTSTGRRESTAEHSWRLALLAMVLLDGYPGLDRVKVLSMCLVHDIGELVTGDVSAALLPDKNRKHEAEREAAQSVFSLLPEAQGERLMTMWEEYNENVTPEARLVKALDKAETILQHNQGQNPAGFDYEFNLGYGKELFKADAMLEELRVLLDEMTRQRCLENKNLDGQ